MIIIPDGVGLFLQPLVQPAKEGALPENAVLGFQHPVVLVGEEQQFGRYAPHACSIECAHTLCGIDAVVFLAMDDEDRGVPFVNKLVWRVVVGALGIGTHVLVPESVLIFPVAEPCLLSVGVHGFEVEGTIVGNEALEALVVVSGKIIYAESTETCAYSAKAVFVNEW